MLRFKFLVAWLGIFLLLASCHSMSKEQLLAKGTQCLAKGDPRDAVIYLTQALKKAPGFLNAKLKLARAYCELGKFDSAAGQLEDILKKNPSSQKAHLEMARVYLEQSKPDQAINELKKIPSPGNDVPDELEEYGWAYAIKKDYPSALSLFQKALQQNGNFVEINILMAKVYSQMGNSANAKETLNTVLRKDASNPQAIHLLASLQLSGNDVDGAIQTYARAGKDDIDSQFREGMLFVIKDRQKEADALADMIISRFSYRPEGYLLKGFSLFSLKNYNGAIEYLRKSIGLGETAQAHYYLGLCFYNQNELELAYNELCRAASLAPSLAPARNLAGLILLKQGRVDDAISQLKQLMDSGQGDAYSHDILGGAYMTKDMYGEALDELGRATAIDPSLRNAYIQKGVLLFSTGKYAEGEAVLEKAASMETGEPRARMLLAGLYLKQNRIAEALRTASQGIKGKKTDATLYDFIADVYLRQGNIDEAMASLQKAKSAGPSDARAYFYLASIYRHTGRAAKAVAELETLCRKNPGNVRAFIETAMLLESNGDGAAALKYYTLALNTGAPEGYLYFAAYQMKSGQPAGALSTLDNGISKNPSAIQLYEMKGAIQINIKDYKGAVGTFTSLGKIDRQAGFDLLVKGYIAMNRPGDALQMVKQQIAKSPEDIKLLATLSTIYGIMGSRNEALSAARQIINIRPSDPFGYLQLASVQAKYDLDNAIGTLSGPQVPKGGPIEMLLGELYFRKKEYSRAENQFKMAESSMPANPEPVYWQGTVLDAMGRSAEAAAVYRKVLSMSPGNLPAENNLAYYYADRGRNPALALRLAAQVYKAAANDGNVLDTYGFALLKNGKAAEAMKALERSYALLPANPTIAYHLALAYSEQGNRAQAVLYLRKCLDMGDFPDARSARLLLSKLTEQNWRDRHDRS
ncbi:MAG: PEP-CTERM system TPR-repeat protein PrsT [Nitrospiraceae bacterium]|nr:PEP-CTERM system TPR-repeat protein PrsT [Nitrospiraceae bacterium]